MVAEALVKLGRPDAVLDWVAGYRQRLEPHPGSQSPISRQDWREALGDIGRAGDWVLFFDRELAETPWPDVVKAWVPRLAPGLMAAATHGLIRTGHAVRGLAEEETPQRVHELAQGLGYWATRFQTLPGVPFGSDAGHRPRPALEHVRRLHGPDFRGRGLIFEQLRGLDEEEPFRDVVDLVSTEGDLSRLISELTEALAAIYLANEAHLIAFVHAVTAPSALRLLAPYLEDADARLAARYAWQACAAIYAWYDPSSRESSPSLGKIDVSKEELIDRAVASQGAHTIKDVEACLREHALNSKPVYLAAARDAPDRIRAS
jgi:hypothetical protein